MQQTPELTAQGTPTTLTRSTEASALEHLGRGHDQLGWARELPWLEEGVRYLGYIHKLEERIQRPKPVGQFHHLGPQNCVLRLQPHILLCEKIDLHWNLAVLLLEQSHLVHQIIKVLLLPHPGPPRRLPVWEHPLPLPLIHHELRIFLGTGSLGSWRRWHLILLGLPITRSPGIELIKENSQSMSIRSNKGERFSSWDHIEMVEEHHREGVEEAAAAEVSSGVHKG